MHPRRRLQRIIDETEQLIIDIQWWCDNRPDQPPIDCEAARVTLATAKKAAEAAEATRVDAEAEARGVLEQTGA